MGYRSSVGIVFTKEAEEKFQQKIKLLNEKEYLDISTFINYSDEQIIDSDTGSKLYYWDYIKWYTGLDLEPTFIENFLKELKYTEYRFIRIGEELDDVESEGEYFNNPFNLDIIRTISFDDKNNHNKKYKKYQDRWISKHSIHINDLVVIRYQRCIPFIDKPQRIIPKFKNKYFSITKINTSNIVIQDICTNELYTMNYFDLRKIKNIDVVDITLNSGYSWSIFPGAQIKILNKNKELYGTIERIITTSLILVKTKESNIIVNTKQILPYCSIKKEDLVLVKNNINDCWKIQSFARYNDYLNLTNTINKQYYPYTTYVKKQNQCYENNYRYCIPFVENE